MLRGELEGFRDEPPSSEARRKVIDGCVERLQGVLRQLPAALTQSRLAGISTRIAVHFFVEKSLNRFCARVLDEVIQQVGAGTGAFVLFRGDRAEAEVVAARDAHEKSLPPDKVRVSRTILARIVDGQDSVLVEDALADRRLRQVESVQDLSLRSILAVPLRVQQYLAGAIHLENETPTRAFGEQDLDLLLGVGRLVAIYLNAFLRFDEEVSARKRIYDEIKGKTHFDGIVGSSSGFLHLLDMVAQVGPSDATVLIEGENGTGKELIARAIHRLSRRANRPMVVVNCAAIPENLLESELFGHEKGAFTGASEKRLGRFEQADGTTLFLDEIAELSPALQVKLLRFLQEREVTPVGSTKTRHVDVRLIAATNRDVKAIVESGEFRQDLYYRLLVVPMTVPPLRERLADVPLMVDHFVQVFALQSGRAAPQIDREVYEALQQYSWPGNVRELENLVQRLVILCRKGRIEIGDVPQHVVAAGRAVLALDKNPFREFVDNVPGYYEELQRVKRHIQGISHTYSQKLEDRFVDSILKRAAGNISRAARESGMHRTLIHRNLRARGLLRDSDKDEDAWA
jgi:transcriptional regulator with GAF, ATPase, and Fis domain